MGRRAFGRPILSDLPAARTIADINTVHQTSCAFTGGPKYKSLNVIVTDTGHGVTNDMKERLFLPYFSTKKRGTGLGLPIVSRIVHEHNGNIRVEKNEPMGSRFIMELPIAIEAAASAD